jgi:hypothetical protein
LKYLLGFWKDPVKLKSALDKLPSTVTEAYDLILCRIKEGGETETNLALRILAWVFHTSNAGVRPLHMEELLHLLFTGESDTVIDDELLPASRNVSIVCQSLIVHDTKSKTVNFTHFSVQEYLRGYPDFPSVSELAKTCIKYLSFEVFRNGPCQTKEELKLRLNKYIAGSFVARFWDVYYRAAEKLSDTTDLSGLRNAAYILLLSESNRNSILQMEENSSGYDVWFPRGLTLLHVIAKCGLSVICRVMLNWRPHAIKEYINFASSLLIE